MVISQGEVWWADLSAPTGSGPEYRRPAVVVQGDALNRSRIATVVCVTLTSNLRRVDAPGNVALSARITGLPEDSVANVSQVVTLDRSVLSECVGKLRDEPEKRLPLSLKHHFPEQSSPSRVRFAAQQRRGLDRCGPF